MTTITFGPSRDYYDRVKMTSNYDVNITDFLNFARTQFPEMCGPIHVYQNNHEMYLNCGVWERYSDRLIDEVNQT